MFNLEGKMDDWGPFGVNEGHWILFSVGNPEEGHGLALPKAIDDFHAKKAAHDLEFMTGQKYVAHVPYTTDRCGEVAKDWSPQWLPWEEFFPRSVKFMKYHVDTLREQQNEVTHALLIIGHGGNGQLTEHAIQEKIQEELNLEKFISVSAIASKKAGIRILNELEPLAEKILRGKKERLGISDPEDLAFFYSKMLMSSGHASHTEHSLAAAMGSCDMEKLSIMNEALEQNFEKALKKWPPIGGLGGYLLKGGDYTKALGTRSNDKYGLWNCLNGLRTLNGGKIVVAPELGRLIQEVSVKEMAKILRDEGP